MRCCCASAHSEGDEVPGRSGWARVQQGAPLLAGTEPWPCSRRVTHAFSRWATRAFSRHVCAPFLIPTGQDQPSQRQAAGGREYCLPACTHACAALPACLLPLPPTCLPSLPACLPCLPAQPASQPARNVNTGACWMADGSVVHARCCTACPLRMLTDILHAFARIHCRCKCSTLKCVPRRSELAERAAAGSRAATGSCCRGRCQRVALGSTAIQACSCLAVWRRLPPPAVAVRRTPGVRLLLA